MIRVLPLAMTIGLLANTAVVAETVSSNVGEQLGAMPLAFTVNAGQWPENVKYQARAQGATVWFTTDGICYQFFRERETARPEAQARSSVGGQDRDDPPQVESMVLKAQLVGGNGFSGVSGADVMAYRCNYFFGNDPAKWRSDVPNYTSITYGDVYDGIDLKFFGDGRQMEYDFIVKPGADPSQIAIAYGGAENLTVNANGDLIIETTWGIVTEKAPLIYQETDGVRRPLRGEYVLTGERRFGFRLIDDYDEALAVVIDPVLTFSTYLGGSSTEEVIDLAVNTSGQAYVCGWTYSADFPLVSAYDNSFSSHQFEGFITKVSAAGNSLIFSTFLGGGSGSNTQCLALSIGMEGAGIFVVGKTSSSSFPLANAFDGTFGGTTEGFVSAISSNGNSLVFSTYTGGSSDDTPTDVVARCIPPCLTSSYNVFVVGQTTSTDFPVVNASQTTNGGLSDAFVTKYFFGIASSSVSYSTYFGGSDNEVGSHVAITGSSPLKAYLSGQTSSTNLPGMNGHDTSPNGISDAFVAFFDVAGNGQVYPAYGTYYGGTAYDYATGVVYRTGGEVTICGNAFSTGLATSGAYDTSYSSFEDVFVASFSSNLATRNYCTYLGSSGHEVVRSMVVDRYNNVWVAGDVYSSGFPMVGAYDGTIGGTQDAFISKFSPNCSSLLFSTFLGGAGTDGASSIAVDTGGCVYAAGSTSSNAFPLQNPYDGFLGGTSDGFVSRICFPCCAATTGNVDCDAMDGVDIGDLTSLIENLFVSFTPLCCTKEANCDGDAGNNVDIGDLTALIDNLFVSFSPLPACQ